MQVPESILVQIGPGYGQQCVQSLELATPLLTRDEDTVRCLRPSGRTLVRVFLLTPETEVKGEVKGEVHVHVPPRLCERADESVSFQPVCTSDHNSVLTGRENQNFWV